MSTRREQLEDLEKRTLEYLKDAPRGRTLAHLMAELGLSTSTADPEYVSRSRLLDAVLQKLRRARRIKHEKKQWWLV